MQAGNPTSVVGAGEACRVPEGIVCDRGYACTYALGEFTGICRKPGTEGGLCDGPYADFAGGDCGPDLRCDLGTAAFPNGNGAAGYLPDLTGICHDASGSVDASAGD